MPIATASEPQRKASASKQSMPDPRKSLVLKGYVRATETGQYEGVCLNLNLAVHGQTLEETDEKLLSLIVAYLADAQKDGTWNDLVPRHAPLSYYATYYRLKVMSNFRSLADFKLFVRTAPCPAHA
jgi:hypothetical protein